MWSWICVGLKTLKREASGLKKVRSKWSNPLETLSLCMMKKVISLLIFGCKFRWPQVQSSVKFGECIWCSVYMCFAFCLFEPSFFCPRSIIHFLHSTRLMWNTPKCWHKWLSFALQFDHLPQFFSSNASSLLKSRCHKMSLIDGKWNETSRRKMKWNSQTLKTFKSLDIPQWNGRLETFKWNEIKKRGAKNGDPSHLYDIKDIKWKAPKTPYKP